MQNTIYDVCIVGSGFCGFAAYKELSNIGLKIILVEGGKFQTPNSANEQKFYKINQNFNLEVNIKGQKQKLKNDLDPSFRDRSHTLGGSSETWKGYIRPFEESTYSNKYESQINQHWGDLNLSNYNEKSLKYLNSPILSFETNYVKELLNLNLPPLPKGMNYSTYAWAEKPLRIKEYWRDKVVLDINNINEFRNVLIQHKLIDLSTKDKKIKSCVFIDSKQKIVEIQSKIIVLAMGGLENGFFIDKLLKQNKITSDKDKKSRITFQEHPHIYEAASFNRGEKIFPEILINRTKVNNNKKGIINNGHIKLHITAWDGPGTPKCNFEILKNNRLGLVSKLKGMAKNYHNVNAAFKEFFVTMRCEQSPSSDSYLSNNNNNNKELKWNINNNDFIKYSEYLKRLNEFLLLEGYCSDFEIKNNDTKNLFIPKRIDGGAHHMSTVFYSPKKGFIDKEFRVKSFNNLYCVGSSAFPLSGYENPTVQVLNTTFAAINSIKSSII